MSEQEKIDLVTFIRGELKHLNDNIESIKDYIDIKYATKIELQSAKDNRDAFCLVREESLNKKFKPIYKMLGVIIAFLILTNGELIINLILRVV